VYAEERDHSNVRALASARTAVESLADDHRVGMVTNGAPEMQRAKLSALPFSEAFETVVYAGYDAPSKPAPEPFRRALSVLDATPERSVHIGNSPSADVDGAHAAGLRAALLPDGPRTTAETSPDYLLDSLGDLVEPPWNGQTSR